MAAYYDIFPAASDIPKLAYHFHGSYDSDALNDKGTLETLAKLVDDWISSWEDNSAPPVLNLAQLNDGLFLLTDTRKISNQKFRFVGAEIARSALFGSHGQRSRSDEWCLENNVSILIGNVTVPLATASHDLYQALFRRETSDELEKLSTPLEYSVNSSNGDIAAAP